MEEVENNEIKDLELKTSGSLQEENAPNEKTATDTDTLQQDLIKEPVPSTNNQANTNDSEIGFEIKANRSSSLVDLEIKSNAGATESYHTQSHHSVNSGKFSLGTTEKGDVLQEKSVYNEFKNNLSNISDESKNINCSSTVHSTKQITSSSLSGTDNYIQTNSSTKGSELDLKEKYKVFPKSVPSSVDVNTNLVTVRFDCENTSFASAFEVSTHVFQIKNRLCYILELEEGFLIFHNNDIETKDSQTLADFGVQPGGKVTFRVSSKYNSKENSLLREKIEENIPAIEVITVHLSDGDHYRDVVVEIENESVQKQWLGGYCNKLTGTVYHNADSQTIKRKSFFKINETSGDKTPLFFNRDTQTPFPLVEKQVNTVVDKATQMSRSDLYIKSGKDKIIMSDIHFKYKIMPINMHHRNVKYIIKIQRAVRIWILRKNFICIIHSEIKLLRNFKKEQERIIQDQEGKDRMVITGAAYPVNRDDFYALFLRTEKWWEKEWKKICETKGLESKKAASLMLIEKEIKLLESIEKHKVSSKAESLKKQESLFLEVISRPVLFRSSKGHLTTIDYLETQTAREFKEMYSSLNRKDILPKDRVELLMTMKRLFESNKYVGYEYSKDLISLIEREIELIGIGFKTKDLKGLQSRIDQLFLNFLHQPEFNPAAKTYKKPNLPKTLHQNFQCTRCLKLLPASKFPVHVRMRALNQCKSCTWMQNIAHQRVDMSPYLKLLHQVQNSEMQKCCYSALCFILQPIGMGHLTNIIWHGHSAISECSNISNLLHVRWLPNVEWAPWNTILLTDQEARLHESIHDVLTFYNEKFIERVRQKHILARKVFIPLLKMDHYMRSTGEWSKISDSGDFLHPSHAENMAKENNECDAM